jgi:hypothetical protein
MALVLAVSTAALAGVAYILIAEPWEEHDAPSPSDGTATISASAEIGPDHIWQPIDHGDALGALQACTPIEPACVLGVMDANGASSAAQEFYLWTGLFLTEITEIGVVDLGVVLDPWRANSNIEHVLLNGVPRVIHVADIPRGERDEPTCAFIWQESPNAVVWPIPAAFEGVEGTDAGGQMYIFKFNAQESRIEEPKYQLRAGFEFSRAGTFQFARWLPCR